MSQRPPKVRYKINQLPNGRYQLDGYRPDGRRPRPRVKTLREAYERRDEILAEDCKLDAQRVPNTTWLKAQQLRDAEAAILCLGPLFPDERWPLCRAAHFAKRETNHGEPHDGEANGEAKPTKAERISQLLEPFLAQKKADGDRPDTIRNLRSRIGLLWRHLADPVPGEVTRKDLESVLDRGVDSTTADNDRRAWSTFFTWCMEQAPPLCSENPAAKNRQSRRPTRDEKEPIALALRQVRRLLIAAARFKDGELVPYIVFGLFCGLRPREAARLLRKYIFMKHKGIRIPAAIAKLRQKRTVEMPPVALAWLRLFLKRGVAPFPKNWRKKFHQVKRAAGFGTPTEDDPKLTPWPQNALRRTAISNRLADTGDENTTADWAGTSPEMIHKYYKDLVWPADSKVFWGLTPSRVLKRKPSDRKR